MADWVIAIKEDTPTHWEIAAREGLWDLRQKRGIQPGDRLYFWQSGKNHRLVGRAIAMSKVRTLDDHDSKPWTDSDPATYKYRIDLAWPVDLEDKPLPEDAGISFFRQLNLAPLKLKDVDAAALLTLHADDPQLREEPDDDATRDALRVLFSDAELAAHGVDQRKYMTQLRVLREERVDFRRRVLTRDGSCLITGERTQAVLQAAHISPYRGRQTNDTRNGLTMRADVHRLFDMHLITLEPTEDHFVVRVSPELESTAYAQLDGVRRQLPGAPSVSPSPQLLQQHNNDCVEWWSPLSQ